MQLTVTYLRVAMRAGDALSFWCDAKTSEQPSK